MSIHQSAIDSFASSRKSSSTSKIIRQTEIEEMKLNILWSKLIIKQIKQMLPSFIEFSAITDSNLCYSSNKPFMYFFIILFYLVIVLFSLFTDCSQFWESSEFLKKISLHVTSIIHIQSSIDPAEIFTTIPFIIIVLSLFNSCFGYFYIFIHKFKTYFGHRKAYEIALFVAEGISVTFLLYNFSVIPIHLFLYVNSTLRCRFIYLFLVIISFSIPYLIIVISRTFSDVKISGYPFLTSNCDSSFNQLISISIICSIIPIFGHINSESKEYQTWILLVILFLSIYNIYISLFQPSFLLPIVQVLFLSASVVLCMNSIIAYAFLFVESPNNLAALLFAFVNLSCPILSFFYYRVVSRKYKRILLSHKKDISALDDRTIFCIYVFSDSTTYPIISSIDFVKQVNEVFPFADSSLILSLRFLYSTKKHPNYIFQRSTFLFRSSTYNISRSMRLATLIELSNELMLSDHYLSSMRLNRLDTIIAECVEAHVIFWEAVLLDNLTAIGEASFLLYDKVQNADEYFDFLKIDENSPEEYAKLYKKFKNKISIEKSFNHDAISFDENHNDDSSSHSSSSMKRINSSLVCSNPSNALQPPNKQEKKAKKMPKITFPKQPNPMLPTLSLKKISSSPTNNGLTTSLLLSTLNEQNIPSASKESKSDNNDGNIAEETETGNNENQNHSNDNDNDNKKNRSAENLPSLKFEDNVYQNEQKHYDRFDDFVSINHLARPSKINPHKREHLPKSNKFKHRSDFDAYEHLLRRDSIDISPHNLTNIKTAKNFVIDGQRFRDFIQIIFLIGEILLFFSTLAIISFKSKKFTSLSIKSHQYLYVNYALFRSSYQTIFKLYSNYLVEDVMKPIKNLIKEDPLETIEKARKVFNEADIQLKNKDLYKLLLDYYEEIIKNNYYDLTELLASSNFINCTSILNEIGLDLIYKDFNQTDKIINKISQHKNFLQFIYKIIGVTSIITIPLFLIICIKNYYIHLNIFCQPPIINKFDVRVIFQYYTSESKRYRKIGNKARAEKEKKEFLQKKKYSKLFNTIFIVFLTFIFIVVFMVIMVYLFGILFKSFTDALLIIEYSSFSCIPYIESLFQLLSISGYKEQPTQIYRSLVSNLVVVSQLINQPQQYVSNLNKSDICFEPSFVIDFSNQKNLIQLKYYLLFDMKLSYKFLATLKLVHFKLIESLQIICYHPENYSAAMLIPHEWFNIGSNYQQYLDTIFTQYKSKVIVIKLKFVVLSTLLIIIQLLLLHFSINKILYLKKAIQFITKILAILPNNSPFYIEDKNEIVFKNDSPKVDLVPLLDAFPISFVTVNKQGIILSSNSHAKTIFKDNVKMGIEFKPIRQLIDEKGEVHYFKIIYSLISNFPYHPYAIKFKDAYYYILIQDITSTTNKRRKIRALKKDLIEYRNYIFPISLSANSTNPKSIILLDNFSIVEFVFPLEMSRQNFEDFLTKFNEMNNKYFSAFLTDSQRCSFFAIFSAFNRNDNEAEYRFEFKQHFRDAVKCVQLLVEKLKHNQDFVNSKIAISQGKKFICKLTESTSTSVEVFSNSLIKSSNLLNLIGPGDIIVESDILKYTYDPPLSNPKSGYFVFNDENINYNIFENGFY